MVIQTNDNRFSTVDFIVSPDASKGTNTTITSALSEAKNGGVIYISPGTYTENLTIPSNVTLIGSNSLTTRIVGSHTPPTSGNLLLREIILEGTGNILNSTAAGNTTICLEGCHFNVSNGHAINLPNWTSSGTGINTIICLNCRGFYSGGANDGFVNNTGGANIFISESHVGRGSSQTMTVSGTCALSDVSLNCPISSGGSSLSLERATVFGTTALTGSCSGFFTLCGFATGNSPSLALNSSGIAQINSCSIASTNNPAITGTGSGTVTLQGVDFRNNNNISTNLTLSAQNSYSGSYKSDYTNHGILLGQGAQGNIIATSEMSNGQLLIGSTGNNPVTSALTAGTNVSIVEGAGSITINSTAGGGITWTTITGTTQQLSGNNGYVINNTAAVSLTLPTAIAVGDVIYIDTIGTGAFTITQAAGQQIHFIGSSSTLGTGGTVNSVSQYSSIELRCVVANTMFQVQNTSGNFNIT